MSHVYRARDTAIGRRWPSRSSRRRPARTPKPRRVSSRNAHGRQHRAREHHPHSRLRRRAGPPVHRDGIPGGRDLRHAIRDKHAGDISNRLRIALDIARALEYTHSKKIIHRDIKPTTCTSTVRQGQADGFRHRQGRGLHLTRTGFAVGTPYYMSPEQVRGEPAPTRWTSTLRHSAFRIADRPEPVEGDTLERLFYAILNEP